MNLNFLVHLRKRKILLINYRLCIYVNKERIKI